MPLHRPFQVSFYPRVTTHHRYHWLAAYSQGGWLLVDAALQDWHRRSKLEVTSATQASSVNYCGPFSQPAQVHGFVIFQRSRKGDCHPRWHRHGEPIQHRLGAWCSARWRSLVNLARAVRDKPAKLDVDSKNDGHPNVVSPHCRGQDHNFQLEWPLYQGLPLDVHIGDCQPRLPFQDWFHRSCRPRSTCCNAWSIFVSLEERLGGCSRLARRNCGSQRLFAACHRRP